MGNLTANVNCTEERPSAHRVFLPQKTFGHVVGASKLWSLVLTPWFCYLWFKHLYIIHLWSASDVPPATSLRGLRQLSGGIVLLQRRVLVRWWSATREFIRKSGQQNVLFTKRPVSSRPGPTQNTILNGHPRPFHMKWPARGALVEQMAFHGPSHSAKNIFKNN